jgi:hypothetical protein
VVIKPYGYAIWEKCKQSSIECLRTGHQNVISIFVQNMFEAEEKMQRDLQRMRITTG